MSWFELRAISEQPEGEDDKPEGEGDGKPEGEE